MISRPRLQLLLLAALLSTGTLTAGCAQQDEHSDPGDRAGIQAVPSDLGTRPLGRTDLATFEVELFRQLNIAPDLQKQYRVLTTANTAHGTYVLYSIPGHDGLAFAGRNSDGSVRLYQANWPLVPTDPAKDLIVCRAVPPNNNVNPSYGVVAGRVYSPYIEQVELEYRDGQKRRIDVSHTRGFIHVRKAFDSRFVSVKGYGINGNPYWSLDTR